MLHPQIVTLMASLVAVSSSMLEAVRLAHRYARSPEPIAIVGPTGCGKSALARMVHAESVRAGPLAEISAGELTTTLAHDQLFGHERGAFTDASSRRRGVFAEASGGTLLLDDFHLIDHSLQPVLLRVLDTGSYRPLGSDRELLTSARLIVGAGEDLDALVRQGKLLPDLRYRLGFAVIRLESLARRRDDIAPLADRFLAECVATDLTHRTMAFAPDVVPALEAAPWPGNVRELRAAVRFAFANAQVTGDALVRHDHLPPHLQLNLSYDPRSDAATKVQLVSWALWRTGDHVGRAAALIHAHRNTVAAIRFELRARGEAGRLHNGGASVVQSSRLEAPVS